ARDGGSLLPWMTGSIWPDLASAITISLVAGDSDPERKLVHLPARRSVRGGPMLHALPAADEARLPRPRQWPLTGSLDAAVDSPFAFASSTSSSTSSHVSARGPGSSRFVEFVNTIVGATARNASTLLGVSSM